MSAPSNPRQESTQGRQGVEVQTRQGGNRVRMAAIREGGTPAAGKAQAAKGLRRSGSKSGIKVNPRKHIDAAGFVTVHDLVRPSSVSTCESGISTSRITPVARCVAEWQIRYTTKLDASVTV